MSQYDDVFLLWTIQLAISEDILEYEGVSHCVIIILQNNSVLNLCFASLLVDFFPLL